MSNKVIKQQLKVLNGEEIRVNKRFQKLKSPLDKVIKEKVDHDKILEQNLKMLRKKTIVSTESRAAQKKRDIIQSNINKEYEKQQEKKRVSKRIARKKKDEKKIKEQFAVQMH
ncbi:hypothetical protein RB653_000428 [Dictyostelium firmibasis]|uniref:Uncharacterized protein n=1 Tax=Dictyostelium firmibasis TaxID=79012 RepID=A0AAN7YUC2_9MYCE